MKLKNFNDYLEKRLDKKEILKIEHQAKLEAKFMLNLQKDISQAVEKFMQDSDIGFNELVRKMDSSPSHLVKIKNGKANLTLSSIAHLAALLGKEPHIVFKDKKSKR